MDNFNPLFQNDSHTLKPKRKTPGGVSASDKTRSLKGTGANVAKKATGVIPEAASADARVEPADAIPGSSTRPQQQVVATADDEITAQMLRQQRAACSAGQREGTDAFDEAYSTAARDVSDSRADRSAVEGGALDAEDFDF